MRSIKNSLFIAYRYLVYHRVRTSIPVVALSIIIFVPVLLDMVVAESQKRLNTRAESTPLILGEKGSSLDLAINSLYFIAKRPGDIAMADIQAVDDTDMGYSIPLYTRFSAGKRRIVGTTPDYVDFRRMHLADGRMFTILGEAVIGAKVAQDLNLAVGDKLISSPENLFDLAGQYPLQMHIVGILAPAGTADDAIIITDIRTTWVMAGLCHGHKDLAKTDDETVIIKREKNTVTANAKLKTYTVITADNLNSFHFHGDEKTPCHPKTVYARSKYDAEQLILNSYSSGGPEGVVLRFPIVYGPYDRGNVAKLIRAIYYRYFFLIGDGSNVRSMISSANSAEAASLAAITPEAGSEIFCVTDNRDHTLIQLIESICKALKRNSTSK